MRRPNGATVAIVALALVLGSVGLARATTAIEHLVATQYSGGDGVFVAFLAVSTTDKTIDATLTLPHPDAKGNTELHPIASFPFPNQIVFKFATKGKAVQNPGEQIQAMVVDQEQGTPLDETMATCSRFGNLFFVCR